MPEFLTRDLKLALSATPEASYNTLEDGAADVYLGMLTTTRDVYIPDKEKQDDTGKIGTGREFPTEQRSGYVVVPSLTIAEELNIDIAAVLLRRCLGGADSVGSDIEPAIGVYKHTFAMLNNTGPTGRQLPSSTVCWSIGGADYLWGGVVVESYTIEQSNADVPTFTANLVGSGIFKDISTIGSPPTFPAPVTQRYMLGAETQAEFNDGSNYVITNTQRLKSFSCTITNNHRTDDRRPGDPRVTATQPRAGHYVNRMLHGDRTVAAEMTVMLDDVMREWGDAYNDTIITNYKYRARGNFLKMAGTPFTESAINQGTFEIVFPKSYFRNARGTDDNGDAIVTISIFPVDDFTTGLIQANITTNTAAVIS